MSKMTTEIIKDIGEIYSRIFGHRQFLNGETAYFVREFEEKRKDREIENLFSAVQNTIDARDTTIVRCCSLSEINLPILNIKLDESLTICEDISKRKEDKKLIEKLEANRKEREQIWNRFVDDMEHKKSRVNSTFEEKEEELREFYSDLERKLHIHK